MIMKSKHFDADLMSHNTIYLYNISLCPSADICPKVAMQNSFAVKFCENRPIIKRDKVFLYQRYYPRLWYTFKDHAADLQKPLDFAQHYCQIVYALYDECSSWDNYMHVFERSSHRSTSTMQLNSMLGTSWCGFWGSQSNWIEEFTGELDDSTLHLGELNSC